MSSPVARTTATYTFLHTENLGSDPTARHAPLPGRPVHDLAYDAALILGPGGVRYSLDLVAGNTLDVAGTTELPARVLNGAGAWLDVPRADGLRLALQIDNLFDARTMWLPSPLSVGGTRPYPLSDFLGFPLPGRTFWLTVRYRLGD
jgi:outer membrane receptor protein involved in Fe transport